jgi:predicted nucleic acid-binding protein
MTDPADPYFSPSHEERERMIAVAAYYLAEHRGFAPGREQQDWQQAERQIDRMLAAMTIRGIDREQFEAYRDAQRAAAMGDRLDLNWSPA